ncbi:MAG: benzoyl-CoA-dihydrodiol lyase [Sandaracinus sp.]|nr:benzoyl-CoA-dihydrodiol lyase [Sandaracinus sp.]|tara:strand:- start:289 stop:1944 length:1656 start_codon:yes stop_codon:yes gene_type:complete
MADSSANPVLPDFETHPSRYKHWQLDVEGPVAKLTMKVDPHGGLRDDYELKLNSYDLGVDIELADAIQRVRFEHPEVRAIVFQSGIDRVFCAGANIPMLSSSAHAFKVNFCKFTNETRLYLEDASAKSGIKSLAACEGTCAGGGYELALACDRILLVDDGSSAVSLPEVPLLAVLPGTGGLTRIVDKRKVRRDLADVFCTTSEGVRGKRAVDWGLVDAIAPRSKFEDAVASEAQALAEQGEAKSGPGITLDPLEPTITDEAITYRHVELHLDGAARVARLVVKAPEGDIPETAEAIQAAGADQWSLRAYRELDDAILRLRMHHFDVGLVLVETRGDAAKVLASDAALANHQDHWLAREITLHMARVLRRLDLSSRSFFAIVDEGSCFAGSLFELSLAADRSYMLEDDDENVAVQLGALNRGLLPMSNGLSRLETRYYGDAATLEKVLGHEGAIVTTDADDLGLITLAADDIDWEDDVRIAIEERASLSPDALTGMEASLRFPGPETVESKIFARLSAWQNWIFQRPNAVGPSGALTKYGQPDRPTFDWTRC